MKTMKMILAGVLLMLPLLCQAQKNLFNKYGDMKGVSSVYISKAMIETNPNLFTKDVYIGKVSGQLNSVQVLSTMDNNVKKEMRKDLVLWCNLPNMNCRISRREPSPVLNST